MNKNGGVPKKIIQTPRGPMVVRTQKEWREITRMKLRQLEQVGFEIMGRKRWSGSSGE